MHLGLHLHSSEYFAKWEVAFLIIAESVTNSFVVSGSVVIFILKIGGLSLSCDSSIAL